MDRDKYRRLFIDEAKEGLAAIANELVAVEKAQTAGDDAAAQRARFDTIFRSAHSLKGMGAAMGFTRFANLAHRLEDLADLGRSGQALPPEAYDLLLSGCDVLESCVEQVQAGDDDPDATDLPIRIATFVEKLKGGLDLRLGHVDPPRQPKEEERSSSSSSSAPIAVQAGEVVLQVQIGADASAPQVRAFVVHKALSAMPGFIDCTPSAEALRQKDNVEFLARRRLDIRFAAGTDVSAAVVAAEKSQGVVAVVVMVADKAAEKAPEKEQEKRAVVDEDRTVRVRTALLDDLIDSVGEVLLARSRLRALSVRLAEPELSDIVDEVDRLTRELHGRVVAARMTPLSFMAERLPRVVRDLARQQGKAVDFSMNGMDIELDRAILDELQAPLVHMVRNAIDHAHEGNGERLAHKKSEMMLLTLSAARDRDRVMLTLKDDGRGMSPQALRDKAVAKGLIDQATAQGLSDQAALELVCLPGFSTANAVTETSGRGVGMDVVKATLERLGGSLRLRSALGQGTTMTLQLPLTVAIIQVLVLDVGGDAAFVLPVPRVEAAIHVDKDDVSMASGRSFLRMGEDLVPLYSLGPLLGLAEPAKADTAILVPGPTGVMALRVAGILGQEEVVAKPLLSPLSSVPFIAGGAILADGRAAYILEPQRLHTDGRVLVSAGASLPPME